MGAWGAGIFSDDTTLDIKDEYQALLAFGTPEDEAYQLVKGSFLPDLYGGDEESLFWFAVGTIQQKYGILTDEVRENTILCIDSGEDLKNWEDGDPKSLKKREKVLVELREKLLAPPLPKKKVPKPSSYSKPKWKIGDLVASQIVSTYDKDKWFFNKYILYRVARIDTSPLSFLKPDLAYNEYAYGALYDWVGDEIPDMSVIENLPYYKQIQIYRTQEYSIPLMSMSWVSRIKHFTLLQRNCEYPMPKQDEIVPKSRENPLAEINYNPHFKELYERLKGGKV